MSRGEAKRTASAVIALAGRERGPASFTEPSTSWRAAELDRRYCAAMARLLTERRSCAVELTKQFRALGKEVLS